MKRCIVVFLIPSKMNIIDENIEHVAAIAEFIGTQFPQHIKFK